MGPITPDPDKSLDPFGYGEFIDGAVAPRLQHCRRQNARAQRLHQRAVSLRPRQGTPRGTGVTGWR